MNYNKVPQLNDKFNPQVFLQTLRKSIWILLLSIVIALFSGFLYLRYTKPQYETSTIIQINQSNKTNELLKLQHINSNDDLQHTVELLRSKEFIRRVLYKMNVNISYYRKGTFLAEELYKNSPFTVEIDTISPNYINVPFFVDSKDANNAILKFQDKEKEKSFILKLDKWQQLPMMKIKLHITNLNSFLSEKENLKSNDYFFTYSDDNTNLKKYIPNINIVINNAMAKTIKINFWSYNPAKSADFCNIMAEEFLKYDVEQKKSSTAQILTFIDKQSDLIYEKLNFLDRQIKRFEKENNLQKADNLQSNTVSNIYLSRLQNIEEKILDYDYEINALKQINEQITKKPNINIYELIGLLSGVESENLLINILDDLKNLNNQRNNLLNNITPDNLTVRQLNKQINEQKKVVINLTNSIINRLKTERTALQQKAKSYKQKISQKNYNEIELTRLQRLYTINEEFYNKLLERKTEYMIYEAGYVSNNTILERAETPKFPFRPDRKMTFIGLIILSLIITIIYIIIKYLLYTEIISADDISAYTDIPIVGIIPKIKTESEVSKLIIEKNDNSIVSEAFRSFRTNLEFSFANNKNTVISITSTISGEGKTFVAINLAAITALLGKRVILLDMDLRKPRLNQSFEISNSEGITTILIGKNTVEECIHHTDIEHFDLIPAGPIPPNPSELIERPEMDKIISFLKTKYDYIIIDTPPIGLVTDAYTSIKKADLLLYVMRSTYSKKTFINNINYLRYDKDFKNIDIILNSYI